MSTYRSNDSQAQYRRQSSAPHTNSQQAPGERNGNESINNTNVNNNNNMEVARRSPSNASRARSERGSRAPMDNTDSPPDIHLWTKIMLAAISVLSLAMAVAQVPTNIYTKDGEVNQVWWGVWKHRHCPTLAIDTPLCTDTQLPMYCSDWEARQRAIMAFSIMTLFFSLVACVLCIVDCVFQDKLPAPLAVIMVLVQMVMSLVLWALIAGSFHAALCDKKSLYNRGYRMSASFALDLCIWFASLLSAIVFIFIRFVRNGK